MSALSQRVVHALRQNPSVLVHGSPGSGKTVAIQAAARTIERGPSITLDPTQPQPFQGGRGDPAFPGDVRTWFITFHQALTYEDFVLGLRPVALAGGGMTLKPRAGPLLEACEHARARDGRGPNTSLLLIDELNRANTARVLGDFITFLDADKRLGRQGERQDDTLTLRFPMLNRAAGKNVSEQVLFPDGSEQQLDWDYRIPYHVYILATMNDLDRSVAPLDAALRRRFAYVEAAIDYDLLEAQLGISGEPVPDRELGVQLLRTVNEVLIADLGSDFQLGPSYFWSAGRNPNGLLAGIAEAWDERIVPQLREYYRARERDLESLGVKGVRKGEVKRVTDEANVRAALENIVKLCRDYLGSRTD